MNLQTDNWVIKNLNITDKLQNINDFYVQFTYTRSAEAPESLHKGT